MLYNHITTAYTRLIAQGITSLCSTVTLAALPIHSCGRSPSFTTLILLCQQGDCQGSLTRCLTHAVLY